MMEWKVLDPSFSICYRVAGDGFVIDGDAILIVGWARATIVAVVEVLPWPTPALAYTVVNQGTHTYIHMD